MIDPIQTETAPHHDAEELLPWYATGQLEGPELALVEEHLSGCAHCRRQLAFERRMVDEFAELTPEVDSGWARLKQRLEAPAAPVRQASRRRESWWDKAARDAASVWQTFTRPAVAAIAFAQLAILVVAGSVLFSLSQPSYRALGSAPPPQSANIIAMFQADTTESQMREILRGSDASLVGGPTPTDAYLLRVPTRSRDAAIARLRADRHVLMAQPIDGATS
jgi:hypothetical protein